VKVTVAVVSWNTRALLEECLTSLQADASAGLCEVWVADNASQDGSPEMVREEFPWVRLLASDANLGYGAAVNAVARRSESEWIAPANADVRLEPGALGTLLATGERDPAAGAVAPRLVLPDGTTQHSAYPFPTPGVTLLANLCVPAVIPGLSERWCLPGGWNAARPRAVPWAVGAFLLVRRAAWDEVGGFDEQQWMYAEDLDLGWRLAQGGWKTRYEPAAVVHHAESAATASAWGDSRSDRWHLATYAWLLRRLGLLTARLVAAINVFGALARAALLAPLALIRRGRWGPRFRTELRTARAHRIGFASRSTLEAHR
jgi:N-acetylglucosaminyl-diphospho-decaprenol L-rhamnosyltransferase